MWIWCDVVDGSIQYSHAISIFSIVKTLKKKEKIGSIKFGCLEMSNVMLQQTDNECLILQST